MYNRFKELQSNPEKSNEYLHNDMSLVINDLKNILASIEHFQAALLFRSHIPADAIQGCAYEGLNSWLSEATAAIGKLYAETLRARCLVSILDSQPQGD